MHTGPDTPVRDRAGANVELALAVDVGGTTIKAELVDHAGTVVAAGQRPTPQGDRAREAVAEVGRTLLAQSLGASVVGAGVVAEHRLGAGVGTEDITLVPIGTGIAASIISGGRLVTGARGETAEIGHLDVRSGGRCACGRDGCLEAVASAAAIARRYSGLSGIDVTGAKDVAALLGTDAVARRVWQDAVDALADALGILWLIVGPALVVIGGGLSRAGEQLLDPLRVALRERVMLVHPADVTASTLGDRGGVIGAALLALDGWAAES